MFFKTLKSKKTKRFRLELSHHHPNDDLIQAEDVCFFPF